MKRLAILLAAWTCLTGPAWAAFPDTTSLVSYWKFDDNGNDSHGSNHLTANGSPSYATGKLNNGVDFEASSSQYMSIASNSSLEFGDVDYTITLWFKAESPLADAILVGKDTDSPGSSRDYTIDYEEGGSIDRFRHYVNGGGNTSTNGNEIRQVPGGYAAGQWVFVCARHSASGDTLTIDTNGVNASLSTNVTPQSSSAEFRIGARAYAGFQGYADGVIDEVSLWERRLSDGEVSDMYGSGTPPAYPGGGGGGGIVPILQRMQLLNTIHPLRIDWRR